VTENGGALACKRAPRVLPRLTRSLLTAWLFMSSGCASQPHAQPLESIPLAPLPVAPQQHKPETLEARTTQLIEAAARHDFEAASRDFDGAMAAALPPQKFAATWSSVENQLGPFRTVESIEMTPPSGTQSALAICRFERNRATVKVVFDGQQLVGGLFFKPVAIAWEPPPYAKPDAFEERSVSVGSTPALPGTLSLPKAAELVPGVVLVHGSGPNDEDESVGAVKVFRDFAWGLATRNIAVLRYIKRSRVSPSGILTQKEEVLDAAQAAIRLLATTPGVDPKKIFVLGHSQGGSLAPRIAHDNPALAGIVVLAGPAQPVQDSLLAQLEYFGSTRGDSAELSSQIDAAKRFKQTVEDPHLKPDQDITLPTGGTLKGAYFLDARGYNPPQAARTLRCPVLVLQGERDYQVSMTEFHYWVSALDKRKGASLKSYPSLNHLFVNGQGPSTPAEYAQPAHVDEAVINDVAHWIRGGTLSNAPASYTKSGD